MMLCALVVLIGHDLVPHQHTVDHSHHSEHHSHPHSHPSDKDHANDAGHDHEITFVAKIQTSLSSSKGFVAIAFLSSDNVTITRQTIGNGTFHPLDNDSPSDSSPPSALGSRAPPVFIA